MHIDLDMESDDEPFGMHIPNEDGVEHILPDNVKIFYKYEGVSPSGCRLLSVQQDWASCTHVPPVEFPFEHSFSKHASKYVLSLMSC